MSGNQEEPLQSVQVHGPGLPQRVPSPNQTNETVVQNNEVTGTNSAREFEQIQSTPITANSTQSSSPSQGTYHITANSTSQRSFSSLYSKAAEERYSSPSDDTSYNDPQRGYNPAYYGGYNANTGTAPGGWDSDRRQSRVSFNLAPARPHSPYPPGGPGYPYDDEEVDPEENPLNEKSVRHAFIRKVYLLISCMMLFTCGIVSVFLFHTPTRRFVVRHWWIMIIAWVAYPVLMIALSCCQSLRRKVPLNYFVLFLVTVVLSFMAGCAAVPRETYEVLGAFGITAAVCLGLTIFAIQTKWDFTVISGGLVVASIILMVFGVVLIFWRNKFAMIAYSCVGAFLACIFFIFDTQMLIGGKRKYALSPEEYVFAAITIFSDMINIFMMLLNIIGLSRS